MQMNGRTLGADLNLQRRSLDCLAPQAEDVGDVEHQGHLHLPLPGHHLIPPPILVLALIHPDPDLHPTVPILVDLRGVALFLEADPGPSHFHHLHRLHLLHHLVELLQNLKWMLHCPLPKGRSQ